MKIFTLILIFLTLSPLTGQGQKNIEQNFALNGKSEVYLKLKFASEIVLQSTNGNEVRVKASVNINENSNNDNFELKSALDNNQLLIEGVIKDLDKLAEKSKKIYYGKDEDQHFYYEGRGYWDDELKIYVRDGRELKLRIDYEIQVPENVKLKVKTLGGNIKGSMNWKEVFIESVSGNLDFGLDEKQKTTLEIKTFNGDVYSNLPLEMAADKKNDLERVGGNQFKNSFSYQLNGGGAKVAFKTITGNIYLRKK